MITPTIHLNGSHGPELLQQYLVAMHAVHDAMVALQKIDINPRDYYVQRQVPGEPSPFHKANLAQRENWVRLEHVRLELEEVALNISNQIDTQKAARA
jgi:hypothetical protein